MVKKILVSVLFGISVMGFAQINPLKYKIDSINQKKWDSTAVNLDSLNTPKLVKLDIKKKDTIILRNQENQQGELPVTPFLLMNTYRERSWFFYGQNNLIFNQSSYSNWNTGGDNSIGIIGRIDYSLIYKNGKHFWDTHAKMGYGMVSDRKERLRKTEDYLNVSSDYGYDLGSQYYLSTGFQFLSQFSPGYYYSSGKKVKFEDRISRFMAPGYLNVGLGVLYNPKENFQVILRPINAKLTFVLDKHLQKKGKYGLEYDGQSIRSEMGAMLNVIHRWKIYKDIYFTNQLNLFSSYTSHPERVDIAYTGTLSLKFNKFITTTFNIDLVYDHDQVQKIQMKQVLGVGVYYKLGVENKEKNIRKDKINKVKYPNLIIKNNIRCPIYL